MISRKVFANILGKTDHVIFRVHDEEWTRNAVHVAHRIGSLKVRLLGWGSGKGNVRSQNLVDAFGAKAHLHGAVVVSAEHLLVRTNVLANDVTKKIRVDERISLSERPKSPFLF